MKFLNIFKNDAPQKGPNQPYKGDQSNLIYNLLFCDNLPLYQASFKGKEEYPWTELFGKTKDREGLAKIVYDTTLESRARILAANELIRLGFVPDKKLLLGVVFEIGKDKGLETIAVYLDGKARYINTEERIIVWGNVDSESINDKIADVFKKSDILLSKLEPSNKKRQSYPKKDDVKFTFLVSDGLYSGQGSFNSFRGDPLTGSVLNAASELINLLIKKSWTKQY